METYDLMTIMKGELDNLNELLSMAKQQQHLLVHGQYESVQENVTLQNKTVVRLKTIERYRNNMPASASSEVDQSQMETLKEAFRLVVEQIKQVNRQNRHLIHRSLSLVRHQLQYLVVSDQQVEGYTGTGDYASSVPRQMLNTTV